MKNWKHFQLSCTKFSQIAHAAKQKQKQKTKNAALLSQRPTAAKQNVMTWHHNEHLHQIKVQPLREQIHHCRLCIILYIIIMIEHNYLFHSTFIITKSKEWLSPLPEEKEKKQTKTDTPSLLTIPSGDDNTV